VQRLRGGLREGAAFGRGSGPETSRIGEFELAALLADQGIGSSPIVWAPHLPTPSIPHRGGADKKTRALLPCGNCADGVRTWASRLAGNMRDSRPTASRRGKAPVKYSPTSRCRLHATRTSRLRLPIQILDIVLGRRGPASLRTVVQLPPIRVECVLKGADMLPHPRLECLVAGNVRVLVPQLVHVL
jgi:hypothetical protein